MPEADDVDEQTEGMAELALSVETWLSTAKSSLFKADTVEWTFLIISFFLEILAAVCDQFFSPGNTQFALTGMWLASGALFVCICELILKWKIGESSRPRLEMFPEIFGLICGISQWLSTIARFGCTLKGMENPFKVNLLPVIFLGCLVARKLIANIKRCKTENRIELISIVHVPSNEPTPDEAKPKKDPDLGLHTKKGLFYRKTPDVVQVLLSKFDGPTYSINKKNSLAHIYKKFYPSSNPTKFN